MRYRSWPASIILSLLDQAQSTGSSEAEVESRHQAMLLRSAIYNYRYSWLEPGDPRRALAITINEEENGTARVRVIRTVIPQITIISQEKQIV